MTDAIRLSAGDMFVYAMRAMFKRFGLLVGLCAPPLLIVVAAAALARLTAPGGDAEGFYATVPIIILGSLAANVALVPSMTGWHRLLIEGSVRRQGGGAYGWGRREWRYFGRLIGIWCLMFVINILANVVTSIAPSMAVALIAFVASILGYLVIWSNMGLGLPASAVGDERKTGEVMSLADGNHRQIALALVYVWLTLGGIGFAVMMLLSAGAALLGSIYLVVVSAMLLYYLALVGSIGVLSRAYAIVAGIQPPPT